MIKKISLKLAINTMLVLSTLALGYHLLILTGLISYQVAWGGRLKTQEQMYVFETISIAVNSIIITIVLIKGAYIKTQFTMRVINILLWILTGIFILNTIGNLFSNNFLETLIFTPVTTICSILCYRMAIAKEVMTL